MIACRFRPGTVSRSHIVQRLAQFPAFLFELAGSHSGEAFELRAEVGGARVAQSVSYFVQGQFAVGQQFFGALYLLGNGVFLDGGVGGFGEQLAQCAVVPVEVGGQTVGQVDARRVFLLVYQGDDVVFDLLHGLHSGVVQQREAQRLQGCPDGACEGLADFLFQHGKAQFYPYGMQSQPFKFAFYGKNAAGAYHVLDVECVIGVGIHNRSCDLWGCREMEWGGRPFG